MLYIECYIEYSLSPVVRSLKIVRYTGAKIPVSSDENLYLVHTQEEKKILRHQGYGSRAGSRVMTIHEAQEQTYK